jgi:hypothetical protein
MQETGPNIDLRLFFKSTDSSNVKMISYVNIVQCQPKRRLHNPQSRQATTTTTTPNPSQHHR